MCVVCCPLLFELRYVCVVVYCLLVVVGSCWLLVVQCLILRCVLFILHWAVDIACCMLFVRSALLVVCVICLMCVARCSVLLFVDCCPTRVGCFCVVGCYAFDVY